MVLYTQVRPRGPSHLRPLGPARPGEKELLSALSQILGKGLCRGQRTACGSPFSSFTLDSGDATQGTQLDSKQLCPLSCPASSLIWLHWQTGSCQCTLAGLALASHQRSSCLSHTHTHPSCWEGSQACDPEKPSPVTQPSLCLCPRGVVRSATTSYSTFRPQQRGGHQQHRYQHHHRQPDRSQWQRWQPGGAGGGVYTHRVFYLKQLLALKETKLHGCPPATGTTGPHRGTWDVRRIPVGQ